MALADKFARRGRTSASAAIGSAPTQSAPTQSAPHVPAEPGAPAVPAAPAAPSAVLPRQAVGDQLRELLRRAETQGAETGMQEWLAKAVGLLVPDEARILQLLATHDHDDPGIALVHIHCLTGTGIAGEAVLENASLVGRDAGVAVPELTSSYLTRLLQLDLVEIGPEDPRLEEDYRRLLGDATVLSALSRARLDGFTPRVLRHTLRLAPLGRALWSTLTP